MGISYLWSKQQITLATGYTWKAFARLSPKEGWDTVVILAGALVVAVWTVDAADWVDTPGIGLIVVGAVIAGLGLAKIKAPWPFLFSGGLLIGFPILIWQVSTLSSDNEFPSKFIEALTRLDHWWEAALTGGISTDLMPFTFILVTMAWVLGLVSSFSIFRFGNVWPALVLSGLAVFTNLSFLPEHFSIRLLSLQIRIDLIFIFYMFI